MRSLKFIFILFIFGLCTACSKKIQPEKMDNPIHIYFDFWNEVDSLELEGQIKTALGKVQSKLPEFENTGNEDQILRAIFYEAKYQSRLSEDSYEKTIKDFEHRLANLNDLKYKRIYHSVLGELYDNYARINQFKIAERTQIITDSNDIRTWSLQDLIKKSNTHYLSSVETLEDRQIAQKINGLLDKPQLTPKGFDLNTLLITRAISHFSNEITLTALPTNDFMMKADEGFADMDVFVNFNFGNSSSLAESSQLRTIQLYQELLKYHKENVLVDRINADRLKYVYRISQAANKNELYEQRLTKLSSNSYYAKYYLASFLINKENSNLNEVRDLLLEVQELNKDSTLVYDANSLLSNLERPHFDIQMEEALLPTQASLFSLNYKNIKRLELSIKPITADGIRRYKSIRSREEQLKLLQGLSSLETLNIDLPDSEYRQLTTESSLPKLPIGRYVLLSNHEDQSSVNFFQVSNLAVHALATSTGNHLQIFHRETGHAYSDVSIEIIEEKYRRNQIEENVIRTIQSDSKGEAHYNINGRKRTKLRLSKGEDVYETSVQYSNSQFNDNTQTAIHIFTDRNLYRPGNQLKGKAIPVSFDIQTKSNRLFPNEALTLTVRDPNYQEIHTEQLVTNEFGSVAFDFIINEDRLAGAYSIELKNKSNIIRGNQRFQVEEYKRPTFTTSINIPKEAFVIGDTIQIETLSELFSGAPLSNAVIEYRVTRKAFRFGYRYSYHRSSTEAEIVNGKVTTDRNGSASFLLPLHAPLYKGANYNFDIQLSIADITGETQFASKNFNVNLTGFNIDLNLPEVISKEQLRNTPIKATNSVGEEIRADVDITVYKLEAPKSWKKDKYWNSLDTILLSEDDYASMPFEYAFNNNDPDTWQELGEVYKKESTIDGNSNLDLSPLEAGFYVLKISKEDKLVTERKFQIIDFNNRINPSVELISYRLNKSTYEVGDELIIDVSIPQEEVQVQYLIERDGLISSKEWLKTQNQIKTTVTNADIGGFVVHLRSVYKNRIYYKSIAVEVPHTKTKLSYTLDSYTSTLEPGEEVEWKVNFKDIDNKDLITESVWSMYDSSLDDLHTEHEWRPFALPEYRSKVSPIYTAFKLDYSLIVNQPIFNRPNTPRPDNSYPKLNTYGFVMMSRNSFRKSAKRSSLPMPEASMDAEAFSEAGAVSIADENGVDAASQSTQDVQSKPRENFEETVFFYPNITSTANGNTMVAFTMNDAMTSWKLLVFAHDKQGRFLYDTLHLRTTQDVFILANKPRFSRLKDKLWMTTKMVNNSNEDIQATTWIEFFDINTGENISDQISLNQKEKQTILPKGSSVSVDWELTFSDDLESRSIGFRTGVKHEKGSDVIEDFLQLLEDSQLVRESEALFLEAGETINYSLSSLGSGQNATVHLELMADLDWQIIQALPYLENKSFETCSNYLYQFVANSIGDFIVNNNPSVKNQLKAVQKEEANIKSQLASKTEFKTIALKKTPWLRNADNEEYQRESMLKYLDDNNTKAHLTKSLDKLLSFQQSDGGFSWLKYRASSLFISSNVLQEIGRLNEKGIPHNFQNENIEKLISFIDKEMERKLSKALQRDNVLDLFSLVLARSYFHDEYPLNKALIKKFESRYSVGWVDYPSSTQATIGTIADRLNIADLCNKILISIQEQAIESKTLGTYWKTNRNYFSNQSSIDKHVAVMEFLEKMTNESSMLEGAKLWLINNKRTNAWNSKPSTSSAIFAFLNNRSYKVHSNSLENINVTIDNQQLTEENNFVNKGTQTTIALSNDVANSNSSIEITNNNEDPIWASVYKSYKKPIREIQSFNSDAIGIEKSIFIKQLTESGPVLSPIESKELQPGDQLTVRLTIKNDRALQFVHIEDKRASGLEPKDVISKYNYTEALYYYQVTEDASTHFLINDLPRGTHVLEYDLTVNLRGEYSSGFSSIQCQYAPEFGAHSESVNLNIRK